MGNELDFERVREALDLLKPNGQLYEIRILKEKQIISGYFTDTTTLEKALKTVDLRGANVFYTINQIDDACYSRKQRDCFRQVKTTTSDADIVGYRWLLVDLDPVRRPDISSTRDEVTMAHDKAEVIVKYLRELGFSAPIMALSGNGIHLLYKVALKNTPDNQRLMETCLKALAFLFSDEHVEIDQKVFNPARISKLYGTMAQKGSSTPSRPHRMSRIITRPEALNDTPREILERLAAEYPVEASAPKSRRSGSFDVEEWLQEHGIRVHAVKVWKDATRYVLEECPFDNSHKAPDATIIKMPNGAICFKCLHNSCSGHDWHELRLKYEPDAYDDKRAEDEARIEAGWKAYKAYNRQRDDIKYVPDFQPESSEEMFETLKDVLNKPKEIRVCIPTGLTELDKRIEGLAKGEISLISGLRGSAKSTWLSQVAINAVDKDYNVLFYSGELKDRRFARWMLQQAAGADHVTKSKKYENYYSVNPGIDEKIVEWMGPRLMLYNNDFGSNFVRIATVLRDVIKEYKSDLVIIDNMSILDLSDITDDRRADKWDQQKLFVELLKNLAMQCNCHIIFVAHPRKAMGFLRLDDVGGTGALGNLVDNALMVHRVNEDFRRGYDVIHKIKWENCSEYVGATNVIEVVKDREYGTQDLFIPMWFEQETRRLKNYEDERIIYGWDFDGFIGKPEDDDKLPWEV